MRGNKKAGAFGKGKVDDPQHFGGFELFFFDACFVAAQGMKKRDGSSIDLTPGVFCQRVCGVWGVLRNPISEKLFWVFASAFFRTWGGFVNFMFDVALTFPIWGCVHWGCL